MDTTFNDDTPLVLAMGTITRPRILRDIFLVQVLSYYGFFWPREFPLHVKETFPEGWEAAGTLPSDEEIAYVHEGEHFSDKTGYAPNIFTNFLETAKLPTDRDHTRAIETYVEADRGWLGDLCELVQKIDAELRLCARGERLPPSHIIFLGPRLFKNMEGLYDGKKIYDAKSIKEETKQRFIEQGGTLERLSAIIQAGYFDITQKESRVLCNPNNDKTVQDTIKMKFDGLITGVVINYPWPHNSHAQHEPTQKILSRLRKEHGLEYTKIAALEGLFSMAYSGHRIPEKLQQIQYPLGSMTRAEMNAARMISQLNTDNGQGGYQPI